MTPVNDSAPLPPSAPTPIPVPAYTEITVANLGDGQRAFLLADGTRCVVVVSEDDAEPTHLAFRAKAWEIDAAGAVVAMAHVVPETATSMPIHAVVDRPAHLIERLAAITDEALGKFAATRQVGATLATLSVKRRRSVAP